MSVDNTTITFQDRRDEDPKMVICIFTDIPDELSKREIKFLFQKAARQAMKAVDVDPSYVDIDKLRAARDAGDISQAIFDQLTS